MKRIVGIGLAALLAVACATALAQLREPSRTRAPPPLRPAPTSTTTPPPAPAVTLAALTISHESISGGPGLGQPTGAVSLSGPAPAGGLVVTLSSSDTAASVPPSVTIQAGANQAAFPVTTALVPAPTTARITASAGGTSVSDDLEVLLGVVSVVAEGGVPGSTAHFQRAFRVTMSGPAPPGGLDIQARSLGIAPGSTSSSYCTPPPSIQGASVAAGATSGLVTITVDESLLATWGWDIYYGARARPQPQFPVQPAIIIGIDFPTAIASGATAYGTVRLNGSTPSTGCAAQFPAVYNNNFMVQLASNSGVVQVPGTVVVAPGERSASFPVAAAAVQTQQTATIVVKRQANTGAWVAVQEVPITVTP